MTPYLSSKMVIALFGASDHHFSPLTSRVKASQDSFQLTASTAPCPSAGFHSRPPPLSAASSLAAEKSICCLRLDLIGGFLAPIRAVAKSCADKNGLPIDWKNPAAIVSKLAVITQTSRDFHNDGGREPVWTTRCRFFNCGELSGRKISVFMAY